MEFRSGEKQNQGMHPYVLLQTSEKNNIYSFYLNVLFMTVKKIYNILYIDMGRGADLSE